MNRNNQNPRKAQIPVSINALIDIDETKGEDALLAAVRFVEEHGLDYNQIPQLTQVIENYLESAV